MAIQVRCPNRDCGKVLSIRDEFGGKTGRCPSCGATMQIPPADEGVQPVNRPSRSRAPQYDDDDDRRPAPSRTRRRSEDDYDGDDDYDDRRSSRRSRYDDRRVRRRPAGSFVGTLVCLGIGIGLMLFLGFIPLFSYAKVSVDVRGQSRSQSAASLFEGDPDAIGHWQGKVILIVTLVVAVFAAVSLVLYLTINPYISDLILTISGAIAGGWALTVLLWLLGFIWKVFTIHSKMKEMVKSNPFAGQLEYSISPGIGLWIGMVIALGSVAVFSILMGLRGKTLWIYVAEGVGLLLGVLMMLVAVQPWKAPLDNKGMPGKGFGPFSQKVMPDRGALTMRPLA